MAKNFFNPILQNRVHIKWLRTIVGSQIPLYSIIVFSERCTLKKIDVTSKDVTVVKRNNINRSVNEIARVNMTVLDEEKINQLYDQLYPYTQVTAIQKKAHIEVIQDKYHSKEEKREHKTTDESSISDIILKVNQQEQDFLCPKCGGTLVLRTVKQGKNAGKQFYGCSNFPKCYYRKPLI